MTESAEPKGATLVKSLDTIRAVKNRSTEKGREFWNHVETISEQGRDPLRSLFYKPFKELQTKLSATKGPVILSWEEAGNIITAFEGMKLLASPAEEPKGVRFQETPIASHWTAWSRPPAGTRQDIVGIRHVNGQTEYLMHNEGLCRPYFLAVDPPAPSPAEKGASAENAAVPDNPFSMESLKHYFYGIENLALHRYQDTSNTSDLIEALEARKQMNKLLGKRAITAESAPPLPEGVRQPLMEIMGCGHRQRFESIIEGGHLPVCQMCRAESAIAYAESLERQLRTALSREKDVLDRESASQARHDARVNKLESRISQLTQEKQALIDQLERRTRFE